MKASVLSQNLCSWGHRGIKPLKKKKKRKKKDIIGNSAVIISGVGIIYLASCNAWRPGGYSWHPEGRGQGCCLPVIHQHSAPEPQSIVLPKSAKARNPDVKTSPRYELKTATYKAVNAKTNFKEKVTQCEMRIFCELMLLLLDQG